MKGRPARSFSSACADAEPPERRSRSGRRHTVVPTRARRPRVRICARTRASAHARGRAVSRRCTRDCNSTQSTLHFLALARRFPWQGWRTGVSSGQTRTTRAPAPRQPTSTGQHTSDKPGAWLVPCSSAPQPSPLLLSSAIPFKVCSSWSPPRPWQQTAARSRYHTEPSQLPARRQSSY